MTIYLAAKQRSAILLLKSLNDKQPQRDLGIRQQALWILPHRQRVGVKVRLASNQTVRIWFK